MADAARFVPYRRGRDVTWVSYMLYAICRVPERTKRKKSKRKTLLRPLACRDNRTERPRACKWGHDERRLLVKIEIPRDLEQVMENGRVSCLFLFRL